MGEVIEHRDAGGSSVRVGDGESRVPVKVYQDVYHQVRGRTEEIRKRYSDNLLIDFPELEQLHHKMMQLCDVHKIVASNEVVSVFHDKERKEQFTSFELFRAYNTNAASPSVSVVLKYNFSLIPEHCAHRPMTDTNPERWRTAFRRHGGQCSGAMPDSLGS